MFISKPLLVVDTKRLLTVDATTDREHFNRPGTNLQKKKKKKIETATSGAPGEKSVEISFICF